MTEDKLRRFRGCGGCGSPDGADHLPTCRLMACRLCGKTGWEHTDDCSAKPSAKIDVDALVHERNDLRWQVDLLAQLVPDRGTASVGSAVTALVANLRERFDVLEERTRQASETAGRYALACDAIREVCRAIGMPPLNGPDIDLAAFTAAVLRAIGQLTEVRQLAEERAGRLHAIQVALGYPFNQPDLDLVAAVRSVVRDRDNAIDEASEMAEEMAHGVDAGRVAAAIGESVTTTDNSPRDDSWSAGFIGMVISATSDRLAHMLLGRKQ